MSDINKVQRHGEPIQLIPGDPRKAVGFLNFSRAVRTSDPRIPVGPNTLGEDLWPVTIQHLEHATRIGYSYVPPVPEGVTLPDEREALTQAWEVEDGDPEADGWLPSGVTTITNAGDRPIRMDQVV